MEAKQCPHVVVADIDTSPYDEKQTVKVSLVRFRIPLDQSIFSTLNLVNDFMTIVICRIMIYEHVWELWDLIIVTTLKCHLCVGIVCTPDHPRLISSGLDTRRYQ